MPRPWSKTVEMLRARAEGERFRLAALRGLPGWREFVVAWTQVGPGAPADVRGTPSPDPEPAFDELLAWCWDVAETWVDAAISAADARLPYGTFQTMSVFITLRGAGLIFPDGGVSKLALDRVTRAEGLRDIADAVRQQQQSEAINESARRARAASEAAEQAKKAGAGA